MCGDHKYASGRRSGDRASTWQRRRVKACFPYEEGAIHGRALDEDQKTCRTASKGAHTNTQEALLSETLRNTVLRNIPGKKKAWVGGVGV